MATTYEQNGIDGTTSGTEAHELLVLAFDEDSTSEVGDLLQRLQQEEVLTTKEAAVVIGGRPPEKRLARLRRRANRWTRLPLALATGALAGLVFGVAWLNLTVGAVAEALATTFGDLDLSEDVVRNIEDALDRGETVLVLSVNADEADSAWSDLTQRNGKIFRATASSQAATEVDENVTQPA